MNTSYILTFDETVGPLYFKEYLSDSVSKLPTRKTRKAAREGIRVRVENNHGRLEQLKHIGFPLLLPMELLLLEEKIRKLRFQNSQRKAQVALNWPKKNEKGYLKSESKVGW